MDGAVYEDLCLGLCLTIVRDLSLMSPFRKPGTRRQKSPHNLSMQDTERSWIDEYKCG